MAKKLTKRTPAAAPPRSKLQPPVATSADDDEANGTTPEPAEDDEEPVVEDEEEEEPESKSPRPHGGPAEDARTETVRAMLSTERRYDASHRKVASAALRGALAEERRLTGDANVAAIGEAVQMVLGVPVPFAFEWLIGANMLPLGRVIQLVGKTGSNKSSLAFEMIRWIAAAGGTGHLFDVEGKLNSLLADSIIGYYGVEDQVLGTEQCDSMDDWQMKLLRMTRYFECLMHGWGQHDKDVPQNLRELKQKKKFKPTGDVFPVGMIVDSLVAKLTEGAQDKIVTAGHAGKKFADEAMSLTYFLKTYTKFVQKLPIVLILINHLKLQKIEGTVFTERKKGGGELVGFQETLEIEMQKMDAWESETGDRNVGMLQGGNQLQLTCQKNSYGPTGRKLKIDLTWFSEPVGGLSRQISSWDWGGAMVDILTSYGAAGPKKRISELVDLQSNADKDMWWSKRLGVKEKESVSKTEIGRRISADPQLKRALRLLLCIREYATFRPGDSFRKRIDELRKNAFVLGNREGVDE